VNSYTFPILRLLADGQFRSGEALARHFGVTRATIWNAVQQAETLGVQIYSVRGKGYRLPERLDFLDQARIAGALGATAGRFRLELHDLAESTNSLLMRAATEGAPHGTCVAAELQQAGRGRRGRTWHSGLGAGLTFSLLWRFSQGAGSLSGLSLAVGVGLGRALREMGISDIRLKWPNDVLHRQRKLAGILIELQGEMMGPSAAVIGIGLNVRMPEAVREAIGQPATGIAEISAQPVDRNQLLASVLNHLGAVLDEFGNQGFGALREEWQSQHAYHGQTVQLLLPDGGVMSAVVGGVAEDGTLLADVGHGMQPFSSAEISLRGTA
jgi:BirA family transcriptional regulator, biotin operon repressor / biotin---[acetyl-CoA-carboxylase] ligase